MECCFTGARSANAFTYNCSEQIPQVDTLTYEGIFNENYFKIESQTDEVSDAEFSMAQVINPLNNQKEQWIGILNKSKYDGIGLREPIDIVVSLDISGSMGQTMNTNRGQPKSRFELAKLGIFKLIYLLDADDGFGFTIFEMTAQTIIPLIPSNKLSKEHRQLITNTKNKGGTNLLNGLKCAYETIKHSEKRSKRIMFVTDLEDNSFEKELYDLFTQCAKEGIFITIIGIGYESNSALAETLIHIKGGNYFLAQTEEDLDKFLVHDFKYICFPATFEHKIEFKSNNLVLNKCFGTGFNIPKVEIAKREWMIKTHKENNEEFKSKVNLLLLYLNRIQKKLPIPVIATFCNYLKYETTTFCKIDTSFPSFLTKEDNSFYSEGGLILLRLSKEPSLVDYSCDFTKKYISYNNKYEAKSYSISCPLFKSNSEFFSNEVIQNGLSLYYYTKLCRTILKSENGTTTKEDKEGYNKAIRDKKDVFKETVIEFIEKHFHEKISKNKKRDYINRLDLLVNNLNDRVKKKTASTTT